MLVIITNNNNHREIFEKIRSNVSVLINEHLYHALTDQQFDNFTVLELRDVYLSRCKRKNTSDEARKLVYRQIFRLMRLGLLEKHPAESVRQTTYTKTKLFHQEKIRPRKEKIKPDSKPSPKFIHKASGNDDVITKLEENIKQYQVDLLASIGESEEYMRLYETFPQMKTHLEIQYHQARERSSKLLGQIKALKNVLSHNRTIIQCD